MEKQKEYDIKLASAHQEAYCIKEDLPMFAPATGICWHCGMNIYYLYPSMPFAYSVEEAMNSYITCCPYCHYSFCD